VTCIPVRDAYHYTMSDASDTLTKQSAIRMSPEFWARADALIPFLNKRRGLDVTRTEVIREAIARGLTLLEREQGKESP
jgi:hypothetical protein